MCRKKQMIGFLCFGAAAGILLALLIPSTFFQIILVAALAAAGFLLSGG